MAKEKHYYLIKQWFPHRGQTEQNPSCYVGPCFAGQLEEALPDRCYTNLKRAERYADRLNYGSARVAVVEVPIDALAQM